MLLVGALSVAQFLLGKDLFVGYFWGLVDVRREFLLAAAVAGVIGRWRRIADVIGRRCWFKTS